MSKFVITAVLLCCTSLAAQAIVIRHDTGYAQHLASESQFPAVFWLELRSQRKICVATLIDAQWALTAAQTGLSRALESGENFAVSIGGAAAQIDSVIVHPNYNAGANSSGLEVDLALLHLASPLSWPAPLSLYESDNELDQIATFVGWGYFGIGTTGIQVDDGRLRQAQNRVSTVSESRLRFLFDDPREFNNAALPLEGLPGLGDSGGPALLRTANGFTLVGVAVGEVSVATSVDAGQGLYGAVAVYERISAHRLWIATTIATFNGS